MVLKDKIKIDKNFINELIAKSWEDSESIQNQIDSIEVDSAIAAKTVSLLKELLTSYYVFTGCLENLETEPIELVKPVNTTKPEILIPESPEVTPEDIIDTPETALDKDEIEPFEYFVDFDDPVGEPLTDDDLYNK